MRFAILASVRIRQDAFAGELCRDHARNPNSYSIATHRVLLVPKSVVTLYALCLPGIVHTAASSLPRRRTPQPRRFRSLPKRARQFHSQEVIDAVVSRPEVAVLHVGNQVLREDRVAVPESVGDVEAAAEALLLRRRGIEGRAPDDRVVEVDAQHQIRREAGRDPAKVIAPVGPDEVSDDMAPRPVALVELIVVVRLG